MIKNTYKSIIFILLLAFGQAAISSSTATVHVKWSTKPNLQVLKKGTLILVENVPTNGCIKVEVNPLASGKGYIQIGDPSGRLINSPSKLLTTGTDHRYKLQGDGDKESTAVLTINQHFNNDTPGAQKVIIRLIMNNNPNLYQ